MEEILDETDKVLHVIYSKMLYKFPAPKIPLLTLLEWGLYLTDHIWPVGTQCLVDAISNPNFRPKS